MLEKVIAFFYRSMKDLTSLIICIYETQINQIMKSCCYILAGNLNFPAFVVINIFHIISWKKFFVYVTMAFPLTQNFNSFVSLLLLSNEFDDHQFLVPPIKTFTAKERYRISIILYVSKLPPSEIPLKNLTNCGAEYLVSHPLLTLLSNNCISLYILLIHIDYCILFLAYNITHALLSF